MTDILLPDGKEIIQIDSEDIPDFCQTAARGIRSLDIADYKNEDQDLLYIQFENQDMYRINESIKDFIFSFCDNETRVTEKGVIQKIFKLNNIRFIIDLYSNLVCNAK